MRIHHQWLGKGIDYHHGLELQNQCVQDVLHQKISNQLLSLEHAPVYTIGRTRDRSSLGSNTDHLPHPVIEIARGGQATYHGPGQLTGYPIIDLHPIGNDLHAYIRGLENALIRTCAEYGVTATQREGLTGVWVENRKLASIGVGVRKWIALHGFAINITEESLTGFNAITPCGIQGVSMTCLEHECGKQLSTLEFANRVVPHLEAVMGEMTQQISK